MKMLNPIWIPERAHLGGVFMCGVSGTTGQIMVLSGNPNPLASSEVEKRARSAR